MIKLHTSKDGQFYFTICGRNGQVELTSETYKSKYNLRRAVKKFQSKLVNPMREVEIFS